VRNSPLEALRKISIVFDSSLREEKISSSADVVSLKADFQSSHEAPRGSLRVHA
jgi:hypothetical protein